MNHTFRLLAGLLALTAGLAQAQNAPSDVDQLRAATARLVNLLVEQGVLTRERAVQLLKELESRPAAAAAPAAVAAAPAPAAVPPVVRVPFVPESLRKEIKEELRGEIVGQALREGWTTSAAVPPWVRQIELDGDLRTRLQLDRYDPGNSRGYLDPNETNRTRAPALLNTTEDRERLRVRGRIELSARMDENWSGALRLTTGSTTNPISSNQTLGTYGNRFTAAFDRAYIRWKSGDEWNAVAGRFGNPWFGTDLQWAPDLGFDGVALQWTPRFGGVKTFATLAAMPVQEVELASRDKWLFGGQVGAEAGSAVVRGKVGLGLYRYVNTTGQVNEPGLNTRDYTAPAFFQKGNTTFNISRSSGDLLALASDFKIVNLTASLDMESIAGKRLVITGDYARNLGFDRAAVSARVGRDVAPETKAYLLRVAFGDAELRQRGQWQGFFGYKYLGRDSVMDAFNDGDFHLGGTDAKGWFAGGSLALGRNTAATLRWMSADAITGAPFAIDVLQLDLSIRF